MEGQDLKQIIREEYILCAKDVEHFVRKFCYIQNPTRGRIQFGLYPFQAKVLKQFLLDQNTQILKSRQLGISTLVAAYCLWLMLFHRDKNILIIATKQETAKNMVTKIKFMYDNLPSWLKEKGTPPEYSKLTFRLSNGSQVKATSAASDAGRSEAVSLLVIDEAAFIDGIELIWASAQQTLATGGKAIVLSTPFGTGNWFHKNWTRAEAKENNFVPIKLPWWVHPERDETWRKLQDEELGDPKLAAQECDCDFITSGDTVYPSEQLEFIATTTICEPIERRGIDKNLWIWEPADYSRNYLVVADVARGDGKDFSACHVFDLETNTQVAEYKGQLGTTEFGYFLVGLATEYNQALLVVENSSIGWATLNAIIERQYPNLYYSSKSDVLTSDSYFNKYEDINNMVPGFTNSLKTRPLAINKGKEYILDKSVTIKSKRTLEEMRVFVWKNGRAEAQNGYNDDLIMPLSIGMYIRDTALKYRSINTDLTRATINNISTSRTQYKASYSSKDISNPYTMNNGGFNEDLRWLL